MPEPSNGRTVIPVVSTILQALVAAGGVMGILWYAVIQPMQQDLRDMKKETLLLGEHNQFRNDVDRQFRAINDELIRLREDIVKRSEHEQHWREQAAAVERLQKEIDEVRLQIGGSYPLGKVLEHLQSELDEIRRVQK